jgi:hypothetical protein
LQAKAIKFGVFAKLSNAGFNLNGNEFRFLTFLTPLNESKKLTIGAVRKAGGRIRR